MNQWSDDEETSYSTLTQPTRDMPDSENSEEELDYHLHDIIKNSNKTLWVEHTPDKPQLKQQLKPIIHSPYIAPSPSHNVTRFNPRFPPPLKSKQNTYKQNMTTSLNINDFPKL